MYDLRQWMFILIMAMDLFTSVSSQSSQIPKDVKGIDVKDEKVSFQLKENPFFLYFDFAQVGKMCPEEEMCVCYWGYGGVNWMLLKADLSEREIKNSMKVKFTKELPLIDKKGLCSSLDNMVTINQHNAMPQEIYQTGHGGMAFGKQMVCLRVSKGNEVLPGAGHAYFDITVTTSGQGSDGNTYESVLSRLDKEGYIKLQFNTRKGVLQPLGDVPDDRILDFFVTSQVATAQAFVEKESNTGIEDTFVEFGFNYGKCNYKNLKEAAHVFFYSPSDLRKVSGKLSRLPSSVKSYIGSLLEAVNGSKNVEHMRNRKGSDEQLLKLIKTRNEQGFADSNLHPSKGDYLLR